ncbi:MAG: glycosyltransferase family 2 protein [Candidatus Eiseniibacteriota bacterium]
MPAISVLMPVRDVAPWLDASLASLWRQTVRDLEVIAVDDGSTDGSGAILDRAAAQEPRLAVVHTLPLGIPAALNTALARARAPLIARHDADDLSHRLRFAFQREHLLGHPRVSVVGCRVRLFPAAGAGMRRWVAWHNGLVTHEAMAHEALIDSPLAHGTALIRRSALERAGGWRELGWAEDLDLWLRMLRAGHRFGKLPRTLYAWRQHPASATRRDPRYARERFLALRHDALARGLLRRARRVTVIGVGVSLETWRRTIACGRVDVSAFHAARPSPRLVARLAPPVVLVFGAASARRRWRDALGAAGLMESVDFAFVA